jgi:hypothetical protein
MPSHTIDSMKKILKDCGVKGYSGKSKAELHKMCLNCPGAKVKMDSMKVIDKKGSGSC